MQLAEVPLNYPIQRSHYKAVGHPTTTSMATDSRQAVC